VLEGGYILATRTDLKMCEILVLVFDQFTASRVDVGTTTIDTLAVIQIAERAQHLEGAIAHIATTGEIFG
jgi:hypothetical protein